MTDRAARIAIGLVSAGVVAVVAYQASARGGVVRVRLEGDRVKLGGQAVTVLRGELV